MSNSSIWPIDKTLSSTTILGQSGLGSNCIERVLHIPQSSSITRTSSSDCLIALVGFRSQVKEESTFWVLVNLLNLQSELMDVHQSDISKMLLFSTSNLVSFMFIKSPHFTWAYNILLHETSHTSCVLFFFWFLRIGSRESTPSVSSR